jgi:hypothetical protein
MDLVSAPRRCRCGLADLGISIMGRALTVLSFKVMQRNTPRGFVTVRFGSGLTLHDCPVHLHPNGRAWVGLPVTPIVDAESGQLRRDGRGKTAYVAIAEWRDRAAADRFSEIVVRLLRQRGDIEGGAS